MEVRAGKSYRCANGNIVGPLVYKGEFSYPFIYSEMDWHWSPHGKYATPRRGKRHPLDLVAEYEGEAK